LPPGGRRGSHPPAPTGGATPRGQAPGFDLRGERHCDRFGPEMVVSPPYLSFTDGSPLITG